MDAIGHPPDVINNPTSWRQRYSSKEPVLSKCWMCSLFFWLVVVVVERKKASVRKLSCSNTKYKHSMVHAHCQGGSAVPANAQRRDRAWLTDVIRFTNTVCANIVPAAANAVSLLQSAGPTPYSSRNAAGILSSHQFRANCTQLQSSGQ